MTETMRAIEITQPGGPEVLQPAARPTPKPGAHEVLIKVAYAGVNRPDALQRAGAYPPPPGASDIPGLEIAGEIVALGEGAARWSVGDRVCALVTGGGYAEFCTAHELCVLPIPDGMSLAQAAAIPETFFTVWTNVFERGALKPGESLLVHGGSSGIGTTAIQLAAQMGSTVYATAGDAAKCAAIEGLGGRAINYREQDFVEVLKDWAPKGVDVILDMVGGDYVARNLKVAAMDGRLVSIAFLNGAKVELDLRPVMMKRLTLTGSTLRARAPEEKGRIAAALHAHVWPLLAAGKVGPVMDSEFPLDDAAAAHARMEGSQHIGKIVLKI